MRILWPLFFAVPCIASLCEWKPHIEQFKDIYVQFQSHGDALEMAAVSLDDVMSGCTRPNAQNVYDAVMRIDFNRIFTVVDNYEVVLTKVAELTIELLQFQIDPLRNIVWGMDIFLRQFSNVYHHQSKEIYGKLIASAIVNNLISQPGLSSRNVYSLVRSLLDYEMSTHIEILAAKNYLKSISALTMMNDMDSFQPSCFKALGRTAAQNEVLKAAVMPFISNEHASALLEGAQISGNDLAKVLEKRRSNVDTVKQFMEVEQSGAYLFIIKALSTENPSQEVREIFWQTLDLGYDGQFSYLSIVASKFKPGIWAFKSDLDNDATRRLLAITVLRNWYIDDEVLLGDIFSTMDFSKILLDTIENQSVAFTKPVALDLIETLRTEQSKSLLYTKVSNSIKSIIKDLPVQWRMLFEVRFAAEAWHNMPETLESALFHTIYEMALAGPHHGEITADVIQSNVAHYIARQFNTATLNEKKDIENAVKQLVSDTSPVFLCQLWDVSIKRNSYNLTQNIGEWIAELDATAFFKQQCTNAVAIAQSAMTMRSSTDSQQLHDALEALGVDITLEPALTPHASVMMASLNSPFRGNEAVDKSHAPFQKKFISRPRKYNVQNQELEFDIAALKNGYDDFVKKDKDSKDSNGKAGKKKDDISGSAKVGGLKNVPNNTKEPEKTTFSGYAQKNWFVFAIAAIVVVAMVVSAIACVCCIRRTVPRPASRT